MTEHLQKTYLEIQAEIKELQDHAEQVRRHELTNVIGAIKDQIVKYGITQADLFGTASAAKPRIPSAGKPAKYRDPISGATWSGHGRNPAWVGKLAEHGKTLADCQIQ